MRTLFLIVILFTCASYELSGQKREVIDSLNSAFWEIESKDINFAEKIALSAELQSRAINYDLGLARANTHLGIVQLRKNYNAKAMNFLLTAIQLYEKKELQKESNYALALNVLSGVYEAEFNYKECLHLARKSLIVSRDINDLHQIGLSLRMIGQGLRGFEKFDSSNYYFMQSLEVFKKNDNLKHQGAVYTNLGINAFLKKDYDYAILYTLKNYEISRKLGNESDYAILFSNLGRYYYLVADYSKALECLDSAVFYADRYEAVETLKLAYRTKAQVFTKLDVVDSVVFYFEKMTHLKDSILNADYKKELAALETMMEVDKHQSKNKQLTDEKRIANLQRDLAVAGLFSIVAVFGIVFFRQKFQVQKKVQEKLEAQVAIRTKEISQQNIIIERVNLQLQLSLNRAKVNPHFIFNVLNSIQHLVLEKNPEEAADYLAKLSRLTRYILEKSSLDTVSLKEELVMLEEYMKLEQFRFDDKFEYEIKVSNSDWRISAMLLQPYVENAIIHGIGPSAKKGLKLSIQVVSQNEKLTITIEDNGMGRVKSKSVNHQSMGGALGCDRLKILSKLSGKEHNVSIIDVLDDQGSPNGTRVEITVPILKS